MAQITIIPGDGIGPEVTDEAVKVLRKVEKIYSIKFELKEALLGGASIDQSGEPITNDTLNVAKDSEAVFLGAVGGPKWDDVPADKRPEKGLLKLRKGLEAFANVRPVLMFDELVERSPLKEDVVKGIDIVILRELISGIYFGEPRGVEALDDGREKGVNTLVYHTDEIERIARKAFEFASKRNKRVTSVDKANVLESSQLWRKVVSRVHKEYPTITLDHRYVDDCAMQLIRDPKQFDVIVTTNLFGDILSDESAMLTGSIGMLPSASVGLTHALYEPVHGSAPDIAGQNIANPIAAILSIAMMMEFSFERRDISEAIKKSVAKTLASGARTKDIYQPNTKEVSCSQLGDVIAENITI